jgi:hypothetical protein
VETLLLSLQLSDLYNSVNVASKFINFDTQLLQSQNNLLTKILSVTLIKSLNYDISNQVDHNILINFISNLSTNFIGDFAGQFFGEITFGANLSQNLGTQINMYPSIEISSSLFFDKISNKITGTNTQYSILLDEDTTSYIGKEGLLTLQNILSTNFENVADLNITKDFNIELDKLTSNQLTALQNILLNIELDQQEIVGKDIPTFIE